MNRCANFRIIPELSTDLFVVIRDLGPWDQYPTVTNSAEEVVELLAKNMQLEGNRRLFYFDSEDNLDEIVVKNGRFAGFRIIDRSIISSILIENRTPRIEA